ASASPAAPFPARRLEARARLLSATSVGVRLTELAVVLQLVAAGANATLPLAFLTFASVLVLIAFQIGDFFFGERPVQFRLELGQRLRPRRAACTARDDESQRPIENG